MEDKQMTQEIKVRIDYEEDCNPKDDEYSTSLISFNDVLNITRTDTERGVDDITLINEAIDEYIAKNNLPRSGPIVLTLIESGEWEDVFWHKWFEIKA